MSTENLRASAPALDSIAPAAPAPGAFDLRTTKTEDTTEYPAVAQVVVLDPNRAMRKDDDLIVQAIRLSARRFIGGYRLEPSPGSDFELFMDQYTVHGHTATLIRNDLLLTTAHSIIPDAIGSTYFIFGRTFASDPRGTGTPDRMWLTIPKSRWARAKSILAMRKPKYDRVTNTWSGSDWAIIELAEPVDPSIIPMPLVGPKTPLSAAQTAIVSYPLGLPRKFTTAKRLASQTSSLLTDFASGASGCPVVVEGKLWGVVSGKARFGLADFVTRPGQTAINLAPQPEATAIPQPITSLNVIRAEQSIV